MRRKRSKAPSYQPLLADPLWYKDAVIYELRTRSYYDSNGDGVGDLAGLAEKLPYLQDLGITAVWLLPLCPSPGRDDGYDIADYQDVHPDVGTVQDFKHFVATAHAHGIRVITELVLNHTSDAHAWFQRARRAPAGSIERDFYVWTDNPEKYREARIIFKDFEPSNWSWDRVANSYYWHRFFSHQPDLNFESPHVQEALLAVCDWWLGEMGVDGLRLDAVPYLYEEEGTNCENLPKTHAFLKKLRKHIDAKFEGKMLLAEANQWPEDAAAYFGDGDECHMNFHFPIMPRMFMAIHMEDRFPIMDILAQTPEVHASCQWALFLRNHDELTLEMVTDEERDYMYRAYANDTTMRINLGIRRRLAPLVGNNRRNMELLNGLLFSLPGTPVLYYGDEIGMGDNVYLGDRNGVRTPMQWSADRNAGFSRANPQRLILPIIIDPEYHFESLNVEGQQNNPNSLLWWTKRLIALRKRFQAFGRGSIDFLAPANAKVLAFVRQYNDETILVVANLSRFVQYVELDLSRFKGAIPVELFGQTDFPTVTDAPYMLTLGGHGFYWFSLDRARTSIADERMSLYEAPMVECTSLIDLVREKGAVLSDEVLPGFLETRHWFAGSTRTIARIEITESVPLSSAGIQLLIAFLRVDYTEGDAERYVLPLALAPIDGTPPAPVAAVIARVRVLGEAALPARADLIDALEDPASLRALLATLQRRVFPGVTGEVLSSPPPDFAGSVEGEVRNLSAEHADAAVRFGDQYILKMFRRMEDGTSPELEMGRFLSERTGAAGITPKIAGCLEYRMNRSEPITLAVLEAYVPNEGTAWNFTREELGRFYERALARPRDEAIPPAPGGSYVDLVDQEPPQAVRDAIGQYMDSAHRLGERTAELHLALASAPDDPAFAPEHFSSFDRRSLYQTLRNLIGRVLRSLKVEIVRLPPRTAEYSRALVAHEPEILKRFEPLLAHKLTSTRLRCHGDYHLGQVLYTGKDFVIIDFEGDRAKELSERRRKRSPLRDVAGMLRSFHYAAFTALLDDAVVRPEDRAVAEPWAHLWQAWVSAGFLRAYLKKADGASFVPATHAELSMLLDVFTFGKAFHELSGELTKRSDRILIPLHGLAALLGLEPGTPAPRGGLHEQ